MASTSFSQRRDTQNEGFTTKEITKKLDEVKYINIETNERDLIQNTLEYFKEVSESYSSKSGDILSNLNMQIEVCKEIFKYIDMKKQPNMLTKVKMTMLLKLKEEERLKQHLVIDLNIFKNLEKLKEEMKVLEAYEKVENLTTKINLTKINKLDWGEKMRFIIDLTRERIKNSEEKMKILEEVDILGNIEKIGTFKEPFTDEYYRKLTEYIENKCAMPLEIFNKIELTSLFYKLTSLLEFLLLTLKPDLCKIVILLIELNNILFEKDENGNFKKDENGEKIERIDDENGHKFQFFNKQLSVFLKLVKDNEASHIIDCKYYNALNIKDLTNVIYTIDNLKTMKLSIDYLKELIKHDILHILNLKNLKDSTTDNGTKGYLTSDNFLTLFTGIHTRTLESILEKNKSNNLLSLDEILKLLKNKTLNVKMFEFNKILSDEAYKELDDLYVDKKDDKIYDKDLLEKIDKILDNRFYYNLYLKIHTAYAVHNASSGNGTLKTITDLYKKITLKELNYLRNRYTNYEEGDFEYLISLDKKIIEKIQFILDLETDLKIGPGSSGGRKVLSVKKEICGKLRCIYKIPGSRKEHIKYKRRLITVTEYKKLMKAKS